MNTQREQIGLLKAFGYTNYEVGLHFLSLAFAAVVGGLFLGILLGAWMGSGMTRMYADYFRFPILSFQTGWLLVVYSILITFGAATVGAVSAVRKAVILTPAEAMRPEAPATFQSGPAGAVRLEQVSFFGEQDRFQKYVAAAGEGGTCGRWHLVRFGSAIHRFLFLRCNKPYYRGSIQPGDTRGCINNLQLPATSKAREELAAMTGVEKVETFRAVPARVRSDYRSKRVGLIGAESNGYFAPDCR